MNNQFTNLRPTGAALSTNGRAADYREYLQSTMEVSLSTMEISLSTMEASQSGES